MTKSHQPQPDKNISRTCKISHDIYKKGKVLLVVESVGKKAFARYQATGNI